MTLAAVPLIAVVVGGFLFGRPIELLVTCGGFVDCTDMRDRYIELNAGAGLASAVVVAVLLLIAGLLSDR